MPSLACEKNRIFTSNEQKKSVYLLIFEESLKYQKCEQFLLLLEK